MQVRSIHSHLVRTANGWLQVAAPKRSASGMSRQANKSSRSLKLPVRLTRLDLVRIANTWRPPREKISEFGTSKHGGALTSSCGTVHQLQRLLSATTTASSRPAARTEQFGFGGRTRIVNSFL